MSAYKYEHQYAMSGSVCLNPNHYSKCSEHKMEHFCSDVFLLSAAAPNSDKYQSMLLIVIFL